MLNWHNCIEEFLLEIGLPKRKVAFKYLAYMLETALNNENGNFLTIKYLVTVVSDYYKVSSSSICKRYYSATDEIWSQKTPILKGMFPDTYTEKYPPYFCDLFAHMLLYLDTVYYSQYSKRKEQGQISTVEDSKEE